MKCPRCGGDLYPEQHHDGRVYAVCEDGCWSVHVDNGPAVDEPRNLWRP